MADEIFTVRIVSMRNIMKYQQTFNLLIINCITRDNED